MGTKPRTKGPTSGAEDPKTAKKKKRWFTRMIRKRKYRSLSEEQLQDIERVSKTSDHECEVVMDTAFAYQREVGLENDIVVETMSMEDHDRDDDTEIRNRKKGANNDNKNVFSSAIRYIKHSFKSKKRRKQNDYSKFTDSTDDLASPSQSGDTKQINESDNGQAVPSKDKVSGKKRGKTKKYVRFEPGDEDKENVAMTIDEECGTNEQPTTTSVPKKKKKSARKRVAKAGRTTGRVFSAGMVQMGRNLQYLSPMPTAHVFADSASSSSSYAKPRYSKPKKQSYKYTASAPPSNPYAFI